MSGPVTNATFLEYLGNPPASDSSRDRDVSAKKSLKSLPPDQTLIHQDLCSIRDQTTKFLAEAKIKKAKVSDKPKFHANGYIEPSVEIAGKRILELKVDGENASITLCATSHTGEQAKLVITFDVAAADQDPPAVYYYFSEIGLEKGSWQINFDYDETGNPLSANIKNLKVTAQTPLKPSSIELKKDDYNFTDVIAREKNHEFPPLQGICLEEIAILKLDSIESIRNFIHEQWMRFLKKCIEPHVKK